ncbi:hypothetical protein NPIL_156341 [Nephila pilipes]|uniref:Uncharacterized protein n=1 Tax=Nephila pilipes TaxID=299642 RepID=A0A8X6NJ87_NEPPI|nr:hypothetical protein NPIL_156341 [Nephila pilipes]
MQLSETNPRQQEEKSNRVHKDSTEGKKSLAKKSDLPVEKLRRNILESGTANWRDYSFEHPLSWICNDGGALQGQLFQILAPSERRFSLTKAISNRRVGRENIHYSFRTSLQSFLKKALHLNYTLFKEPCMFSKQADELTDDSEEPEEEPTKYSVER